jgi:histidinol-phosphate aminotransferase
MSFDINQIARKNIIALKPYTSARDEFNGNAEVYLDANENSYGSPLKKLYNRYPDPYCTAIKEKLSHVKGVPPENIFVGNGSDEAIDLLYRVFCEPGVDNVITCPPTYGMYSVSAAINNVALQEIPLLPNFQLNLDAIAEAINEHTKIIWICSPNNPTGNSINKADIEIVLNNFNGIVVIDEAYINFSRQSSCIKELTEYPNLVIMQTFSKAWGLAALRVGMAYASTLIIELLNKTKPPYNVSEASQSLVLEALENMQQVNTWTVELVKSRNALAKHLAELKLVAGVYDSDANFLLVKCNSNATEIYNYLIDLGIVVRNRSNVVLIENCLRITVGTAVENDKLVTALKNYKH